MAVSNDKTPRVDVGSDWSADTLKAVQDALKAIEGKLVVHYWCDTLSEAVTVTTTAEDKDKVAGIALCPNGIVVRGALVAAPNQSIVLKRNDFGVKLTVDGTDYSMRTSGGMHLGVLNSGSDGTIVQTDYCGLHIQGAEINSLLSTPSFLDACYPGDYFTTDGYYTYPISASNCDVTDLYIGSILVLRDIAGVLTWVAEKDPNITLGSEYNPLYFNKARGWMNTGAYAGGTQVTLNGKNKESSGASFYAPTTAGTSGQILKSNGSGAPTWMNNNFATKDDVNNIINSMASAMVYAGEINASTGQLVRVDASLGDWTNHVSLPRNFSELPRVCTPRAGWTFRVTTAGDMTENIARGLGGTYLEAGDMIVIVSGVPSNGYYNAQVDDYLSANEVSIIQNNVDKATSAALGLVKVPKSGGLTVDSAGAIGLGDMSLSGGYSSGAIGFTVKIGDKSASGIAALPVASTTLDGIGKVGAMVNSVGVTTSQTSSAANVNVTVDGKSSGDVALKTASTSNYGVTKLTSSVSSSSTTLAATASAVKAVNDKVKIWDVGNLTISNGTVAYELENAGEGSSGLNIALVDKYADESDGGRLKSIATIPRVNNAGQSVGAMSGEALVQDTSKWGIPSGEGVAGLLAETQYKEIWQVLAKIVDAMTWQ